MTGKRSPIGTMARDLWLEDARRVLAERRAMGRVPDDGKDIDPSWYDQDAAMPLTGPGFVAKWEGLARAALRSLIDAGLTPSMRRALGDQLDAWVQEEAEAGDVFAAPLRAALEEADNHG